MSAAAGIPLGGDAVGGEAAVGEAAVMDLARRCRALFAEQSTLRPADLPVDARRRTGTFRDRPIELVASAWAGGRGTYARVVTIVGPGLAILNVLGLPAVDGHVAPEILGVDVVARDGAPAVVVADVSSAGGEHGGSAARLAPRIAGLGPFPPAGPLPGWCARWFSPHHLYTRVASSDLTRAAEAAFAYVQAWVGAGAAVHRGAGRPSVAARAVGVAASAAISAYCHDHRTDDPGLRLLDRMFGPAWAASFRDEVLFPTEVARRSRILDGQDLA